MSKNEEKRNMMQEESQMTPPDAYEEERELKTEEQEAIEAIRKFTDEDEDDMGEISVKSILGGDFLMSKFMVKQIMFVMFCVALMLLYTGNRYDSQQDAILIDSLRERLQEVKYNVLTQSSELMNLTRQSNVEKVLKGTQDSLLHNSITPPFLIKMGDSSHQEEADEIEEVLVDTAIKHVAEPVDEKVKEKKNETSLGAVGEKKEEKKEDKEPEKERE